MRSWKTLAIVAAWGLGIYLPTVQAASGQGQAGTDSFQRLMREAAFVLLKEGNARFVGGALKHPNLDAERRKNTVAEGQEPFASILACSDSRDPVELIFDRGIGDLFVVRVAGNVAGISELATLEYGVGHLHTPLVVVLGHSKCGAVTAVVKDAELHGHLPKLAEKIRPAATKARETAANPDAAVPVAIEANVWQGISDVLRLSTVIREAVVAGKVQIVGALYDLESGAVNFLGQHPEQAALLTAEPPPAAEHAAEPAAEHGADPQTAQATEASAPGTEPKPHH